MLSRVYLGVHHLGDVLAGFAVGCVAVLVHPLALATPRRLAAPTACPAGPVSRRHPARLRLPRSTRSYRPMPSWSLARLRHVGRRSRRLPARVRARSLLGGSDAAGRSADRRGPRALGASSSLRRRGASPFSSTSRRARRAGDVLGAVWGLFVVPALYRYRLSCAVGRGLL